MAGKTTEYELPYATDSDAPDGPTQQKALAEAVEKALGVLIPAGTIVPTARSAAPTGWLLCDGTAVSRTTYSRLWSAIETSGYGNGNGTTTFNVPDLRGRVPVGVDGAAARMASNDTLGKSAGEELHKLTEAELAKHRHGVGVATLFMYQLEGVANGIQAHRGGNGLPWDHIDLTTNQSEYDGEDTPHNNMPPYQIVNYLIKI